MDDTEIRSFATSELRFIPDADKPRVEGIAMVYDALSDDLGGYRERFAAGSIQFEDDLLALFNHDTGMVLGRVSAGTLEATNGPTAVSMRAYPPDTQWARDMRISMERGDLRHMSIRFRPLDDDLKLVDGEIVRTVKAAEVSELSIVAMPAYPQTSAHMRSRVDALRKAACSTEDATDAGEAGGSPEQPTPEGGSPERLFLAGGRLITLHETDKGE